MVLDGRRQTTLVSDTENLSVAVLEKWDSLVYTQSNKMFSLGNMAVFCVGRKYHIAFLYD